eukprot:2753349-Amphidinium_carterae.1
MNSRLQRLHVIGDAARSAFYCEESVLLEDDTNNVLQEATENLTSRKCKAVMTVATKMITIAIAKRI